MKVHITLKCVTQLENRFFVERLSDNLETYRKPIQSDAARDGCRAWRPTQPARLLVVSLMTS